MEKYEISRQALNDVTLSIEKLEFAQAKQTLSRHYLELRLADLSEDLETLRQNVTFAVLTEETKEGKQKFGNDIARKNEIALRLDRDPLWLKGRKTLRSGKKRIYRLMCIEDLSSSAINRQKALQKVYQLDMEKEIIQCKPI